MSEFRGQDPQIIERLKEASAKIEQINQTIGKKIIGQQQLRHRLITALLANGHVLLEGVPGLAKTLSIKALSDAVDGSFQRIQFTPDLLPADLTGTEVYRPQQGTFEIRKGPVFTNFVLADEINRAPAKVQSALLETMQERQVTIGNESFSLPSPFFVLATQNPVEQEGTYPLPEAQIDRFIVKVKVDYPSPQEEQEMLGLVTQKDFDTKPIDPVVSPQEILELSSLCENIYVDERIRKYIVDIVGATRAPDKHGIRIGHLIELGASPRASISFFLMARAEALIEGTGFVTPQHIKEIATDILRHRIVPSYEAEAEGLSSDNLIKMILDGVDVP